MRAGVPLKVDECSMVRASLVGRTFLSAGCPGMLANQVSVCLLTDEGIRLGHSAVRQLDAILFPLDLKQSNNPTIQ